MKLKFLTILFSLIFLCSFTNTYQTTYEPLNDISFNYKNEANVLVCHQDQIWKMNYAVYNQTDEFASLISTNIIPLSHQVFQFADLHKIPLNECIAKDHLEIFQISQQTLNDHTRFDGWQPQNDDASIIWGLYDPRLGQKIFASIMISDHGPKENPLIFAHELSHYWYDRFCWNQYWNNSDEQFALDFEKFYLEMEKP